MRLRTAKKIFKECDRANGEYIKRADAYTFSHIDNFSQEEHGKEHRKPYSNRGLRRYGYYCLCDFDHSPKRWQDPWERDNRLHCDKYVNHNLYASNRGVLCLIDAECITEYREYFNNTQDLELC